MFTLKTVGLKIQMNRKLKNLTQEDLAKKADISLITVRKIEQGKSNFTMGMLQKICDVLEINGRELF